VRQLNNVLLTNSTPSGDSEYTSNVHVHAGQAIGLAGSTGMSRFPHIHLGLYDGARNVGLVFRDGDTQRHGGKCYTFRLYKADGLDLGLMSLREDGPP
jgi:hypothetical protein